MVKVGIATHDWAHIVLGDRLIPHLRGCGWVRLGQYLVNSRLRPVIGKLIFEDKKGVFGIEDMDELKHWNFDIIISQRNMHKGMLPRLKTARQNGQVFVSEIDDWYWGGGAVMFKNLNWAAGQARSNPDNNVNHYRQVVARSTAVILSTPYLADRITWVDPDRKFIHENHVDFASYPKWEHSEADCPTIGWTGTTGLRVGDLGILKKFYSDIADEFQFHHSGHQEDAKHPGRIPTFAQEVGLPEDRVFRTPSDPFIGRYREIAFKYDIGVVPLVETPFNLAKSWLKGLEYTAAGIPWVASPVGEYVRLEGLYGVGRYAKTDADWKRHLRALKDPDLRKEEAAGNLEKVQSLDTAEGTKKWDDLVEHLATLS